MFRGVPRGHFMIGIQRESAPSGWTIKSELLNGRDVLDFPFDLEFHEHVGDIVITFTDQQTELSGTVVGADGKPNADATVLVFATDDRFWTPRSRRIEAARPDINGHFNFRGLPAGEYLLAVAEPDVFGKPDRSVLKTLRSVSVRVTLHEGVKQTQDLRIALAWRDDRIRTIHRASTTQCAAPVATTRNVRLDARCCSSRRRNSRPSKSEGGRARLSTDRAVSAHRGHSDHRSACRAGRTCQQRPGGRGDPIARPGSDRRRGAVGVHADCSQRQARSGARDNSRAVHSEILN